MRLVDNHQHAADTGPLVDTPMHVPGGHLAAAEESVVGCMALAAATPKARMACPELIPCICSTLSLGGRLCASRDHVFRRHPQRCIRDVTSRGAEEASMH
jgi:hypothetical protein